MSMRKKTVSINHELHVVLGTLRVVRELADHWSQQPAGIGGNPVHLLHDLAASLVVIEARLVLLQRAVRGKIDPEQLWCAANDGDAEDKEDIALPTWSLRRIARQARREWKSAKTRLAWKAKRETAR